MGHGYDALYRMAVTFYLHGVNCMNVFWFRSKPTTDSPTLQFECDNIESDWRVQIWPVYKLAMSNECSNIAAVVQCMSPPGLAMTVASYVGQTGTIASESLPSFNSSVLSMYTKFPGRRTHGRVYVPGIPESESSGSVVITAQATRLANLAAILINRWGETGSSLRVWGGVYSRKNGNSIDPGPPPFIRYSPLAHVPWTRAIVNTRIRTERHRMQGHGY